MIKVRFLITFSFLMVGSAASAHDFSELEVVSVRSEVSDYYEININNTVKDVEIVCALYSKDRNLLTSDTGYTDNLATKFLISYTGGGVESAKCVIN